ncbi:MAG: sodium/solute symporter [Thermoguttaceae bacterium]|nr:sodium/solute symporter [Thermoguttaceae bacterium]
MSNLFLLAQSVSDTAVEGTRGYCADIVVFVLFLLAVIFTAFSVSRKSNTGSESYFLAGRGLSWWLIGVSLIAANISAEQFIGMSGNASDYIGMAVASYEWIAALSLVIVAFFFLPRFLRAGIYTIPEYLENRFSKGARTIMSLMMVIMLIAVNFTAVTYAGAKYFDVVFSEFRVASGIFAGDPVNLTTLSWFIGILAAAYVFAGGLKACAWADLLQGSALIVGGAIVLYFALHTLGQADPQTLTPAPMHAAEFSGNLDSLSDHGAIERFRELNLGKLRMNLPSSDKFLPITALLLGIWIPNLYYWGLNQYIIQRTLGSKSLAEGQKGLVFAAVMKLIIPFIIVFPGIIAYNLYYGDMKQSAAENAAAEMTRLQQIRSGEDTTLADEALFSFTDEFGERNPEKAREMLLANAAIIEVELDETEDDLGDMHEDFMAKLLEKDRTDPSFDYSFNPNVAFCDYDAAFPLLVKKLVPRGGFKGFLLAALLGAIISSVAAMLNAASTIFTMDIYREYFGKRASDRHLVSVGRMAVVVFVIVGCWLAPQLANPRFGGIFKFIQEFQGYISPGILAAFAIGFCVKRAPSICGVVSLLLCPVIYGCLHVFVPSLDFLNRMVVTFFAIIVLDLVITVLSPRKEAFALEAKTTLNLSFSKIAVVIGILVVITTICLYALFWDYSTPMFD